jgi:hypothetical protein
MSLTTPDWLEKRGGRLQPSKNGGAWLVYVGGEPQYMLIPSPARGKFSCRIAETINGRRFDSDATYANSEDALRGGLDELRKTLGW